MLSLGNLLKNFSNYIEGGLKNEKEYMDSPVGYWCNALDRR